jgi:hypothetical protein
LPDVGDHGGGDYRLAMLPFVFILYVLPTQVETNSVLLAT